MSGTGIVYQEWPTQHRQQPVENSIRPVAIGRKNYLFAGSHEAARHSAMLDSLPRTCKFARHKSFYLA